MENLSREAEAADATDIARLCYLAGKSHVETSIYDIMIDGPSGMTENRVSSLARIIASEKPSWLSYKHYRVIDLDGRLASGLATFTTEQAGNRELGKAMMDVGWGVRDMLSMSRRLKVWSKADPGREPGFLIIENVATFEEFRVRGFTSTLLQEAKKSAADAGFKGLQLTVMLGNEPAIRAYEKAGFRMEKTSGSEKFEKAFACPGAGQMLLKF